MIDNEIKNPSNLTAQDITLGQVIESEGKPYIVMIIGAQWMSHGSLALLPNQRNVILADPEDDHMFHNMQLIDY